jgi:hypothetical protein
MHRWKLWTLKFSILVLNIFLVSTLVGQDSPSTKRIPDGWYIYPNSKLKGIDESTLRCFNYSHNAWRVVSAGEEVKITKWTETKPDIPALPSLLKHQSGMPGNTVNAGLRSAAHYAHGWLLAYDFGEWGGGLWLTNDDGSVTKQILSDNVRGVVPVDGGILVLSGLAHLTMDFGNAFLFSEPDGLNIKLQHSVHLDGAPSVYAKEAGGSVLFVTTYGLCRITKSGELQMLTYFPKWTSMQYPNSMVLGTDGAIFIGMRMVVLRLSASATGYRLDWLLPRSCRTFEIRQYDCVCKP